MRIATRLVLILGISVAAVVTVYALIALRQREAMIKASLIRETETLAWALNGAAEKAVQNQRLHELDAILQHVVRDPETFVSVLLDAEGRTLAGGADADVSCVGDLLPATENVPEQISGWADCDGPVRWVISPVAPRGTTLLLARRASFVEKDIASSRWRHLLLTLALVVTTALVIFLVLGRILTAPLSEILHGVRRLSGSGPPSPIRVPKAAGELAHLGKAFNRMARRLERRRLAQVAEGEERVALERRLGEAEKFAAVGRLTGGVAHELGSPLNVIAMRAEAINAAPDAPPAVRRQAEQIVAEVDRISDLVRGLLHVARRNGVDPRPLELEDVVQAAIADIQADADAGNIDVEAYGADRPILVHGDATLLRHALLNLLRNAVHALEAHPGPRHLSVQVEEGETQVSIRVRDTGPGIARENLEHIFEPFFTTKDVGEGTGLGLAISRGIVEEHGGQLELTSSEDGVGVCATMTLPVAGPANTAMAP